MAGGNVRRKGHLGKPCLLLFAANEVDGHTGRQMGRDLSRCVQCQVLFLVAAKGTDEDIALLCQPQLLALLGQGGFGGFRQAEGQGGVAGIQMQGVQHFQMVQRLMPTLPLNEKKVACRRATMIYENLAAVVETGWAHGQFQESVWGHKTYHRASNNGDNEWKVAFGFSYKF